MVSQRGPAAAKECRNARGVVRGWRKIMSCVGCSNILSFFSCFSFPDQQRGSAAYRASIVDKFQYSWTATVLVIMAGQSFVCSGVGHTENKEDATRAKKKAVTNA